MAEKFKPLGNRILVEQNAADTKTAGGLIIPESDQSKSIYGRVLEVGDVSVKVGDKVMFSEHAGMEIKVNFKKYLLIRESELLGVLTEIID